MAGSLDLTDTDLSDLSDRYPDIKFDVADDFVPDCTISEHFSSPCSNSTDHDATPTSKKNTASTAHTTPLRPLSHCAPESDIPTLDLFLEDISNADLPLISKEGFACLAQEMTILGALLVPESGDLHAGSIKSNKPKIHHQTQMMLSQLQKARDRVTDEIDNVDWIITRAPFTVEPAHEDLWCNYRQRGQLISQYTVLPCRTEKSMLEELTHIFDAYVYHSFLELLALGQVDAEIEDAINGLYDVLMTLLHNYNRWMTAMQDLKQNHMQPYMKKIRKSPEIRRDIAEAEFVKMMAKASIGSPEAPGMQPADERTIQELNLSTSRRYAPIPRRTE
ncbi:hypothetical protein H2200_012398 [Cladophialophora chaetospira]|uniref:Uncharacterized protein n=1 Tax=Cladophialophora chaetospira TaxID=386627 RepID=A0AA38WXR7_9EURO|nr:hypothetical protein H2200_012398 [Cladophialophora chaetospira]